jgi:glycosyltransferase involved in cell wall biosynthesis
MKKILHIISQYPGRTGSGIYLNALAKEGKRKGYTQGLIAGIPYSDNFQPKYVEEFYPMVFNTEELPFSIVGMSDTMPYESTRYNELTDEMLYQWESSFRKAIIYALEDFKPDIILSHHLWLSTSLVRELAPDTKVIGICHGTDIRQLEKCPQYKDDILSNFRKLDLVLSLSDFQREDIERIYNIPKSKIVTIGGGYDEDIFFHPLDKVSNEKIKIVYAGKFSFAKGLVSLLNIFKGIREKDNLELYLAGSGTGKEEKFIKTLAMGIGSNISFLGELTQKELGQVFRESHIFILPSFFEGLSLVSIEALASGMLIVATEIEGLKSNLGSEINENGIIEYVKLPRMMKVDEPLKEDLEIFENRFKLGIEKQIERIKKGYKMDEDIKKRIKEKSWKNIFNKIIDYIECIN